MAKDVPQMVRGLGMATRFLSSLTDEIKNRGGHEEMLHFLTTERGRESIGKIAEFIIGLPWRVPKSLVMQVSRESSIARGNEPEYVEIDENFWWENALRKFGIPWSRFVGEDIEKGDRPLSTEVIEQLHGKKAHAGMIVMWEGQEHVVSLLYSKRTSSYVVGEQIDKDDIRLMFLSPAYYFDLNA